MTQIAEDTLNALAEKFPAATHRAAIETIRQTVVDPMKTRDELERMLEEELEKDVTQES